MDGKFLVAVAFLIERDGHVLLLRRSATKDHAPGEWDFGSGKVKQGETPLDALHREVKEETGLTVEVIGPLDTFHFYRGAAREEAIGIAFHCRATGGELKISPEHDDARWVRLDEALDVDCADWMRRCLTAVQSRRPDGRVERT